MDGVAIAGLVQISQLLGATNSGIIKTLGFDGLITLESGQKLRINDPNAVYSAGYTAKPAYTADDQNPSITGMIAHLPSLSGPARHQLTENQQPSAGSQCVCRDRQTTPNVHRPTDQRVRPRTRRPTRWLWLLSCLATTSPSPVSVLEVRSLHTRSSRIAFRFQPQAQACLHISASRMRSLALSILRILQMLLQQIAE